MIYKVYTDLPISGWEVQENISLSTVVKTKNVYQLCWLLEAGQEYQDSWVEILTLGVQEEVPHYVLTFLWKTLTKITIKQAEKSGISISLIKRRIRTLTQYYYKTVSEVSLGMNTTTNCIEGLHSCFIKNLLSIVLHKRKPFSLTSQQQAMLLQLLGKILEGTRQLDYYEWLLGLRQEVDKKHCLVEPQTQTPESLLSDFHIVLVQQTREPFFRWISWHQHLQTLCQYSKEGSQQLRKLWKRHLTSLILNIQTEYLPRLETIGAQMLNTMIRWDVLQLANTIWQRIPLSFNLQSKYVQMLGSVMKYTSRLSSQCTDQKIKQKYVQYYHSLSWKVKEWKGVHYDMVELREFYPSVSRLFFFQWDLLAGVSSRGVSRLEKYVLSAERSMMAVLLLYLYYQWHGSKLSIVVLEQLSPQDFVQFVSLAVFRMRVRDEMFLMKVVEELSQILARLRVEGKEDVSLLSGIVKILFLIKFSFTEKPKRFCSRCFAINQEPICLSCNYICQIYQCQHSLKSTIFSAINPYMCQIPAFIAEIIEHLPTIIDSKEDIIVLLKLLNDSCFTLS